MSFDVSPLNGITPSAAGQARRTQGRDPSTLQLPGAGQAPPIPPEVREQMSAAAALADDLHAHGHSVRFDLHKLDGRVVASLIDEHAGFKRPLLLADVLDPKRLKRHLEVDSS